ncbi:substrate-binding domain-containing protein [Nocardioides sp.]|uniref:sugar ABC transporter substrate-binding protein n=1 Tax=Nocardioides sp. TaxID=35761 RepID=UPI002613A4FE|nr:substrate-binding domain-containing protein [Nocardioides sp.]MDI6909365.1 substrate-binding domain-containing protein [Nocardioides sp.]
MQLIGKPLRRTLLAAGALVASATLAACGGSNASGADGGGEDDGYVIGVSMVTSTRGFHSELYDGIKAEAEKLGVEVIETDANEDVVQQLDDVDSLLNRDVDALLIVPVDEVGSVPAYEAADAAGVPVVSLARDADTDLKESFVGAEWGSYGAEIAAWTCVHTGGAAHVAMIKGPSGASHVNEMYAGYTGYIESDCPGMEVVFEANAETDGADPGLTLAQDALAAEPDLDVIYVNADDTAMGVLQALVEQDRIDDVTVTGFNGEPDAFDAIREGTLEATYALRPYRWGALALAKVVDMLDGEDLPDLVPIETVLVDTDNIDDFDEADLR